MTATALTNLFRSLRTVGLTRGQVDAILPAGGCEIPCTLRRAHGDPHGRRLHLDALALLEGRVQRLREVSPPRYKHTVRVTSEQLMPATLIASSVAKAIIGSMPARQIA